MDYDAQKNKRYSGVPSVNYQDLAVQEGMGPIVNRTKEHLGTADSMIIRIRKRLINAAMDLRDHGLTPPGIDDPAVYRVRSATVAINNGEDWMEAARSHLQAFTDLPVMSADIRISRG